MSASSLAGDSKLSDTIREASSTAPVLEPFTLGEPRHRVFRLNSTVISREGERYSMIRLRAPAGRRQPLVWMFSDIGTIQEYELIRVRDGRPIRGNLRVIYPRLADPDHEDNEAPVKASLSLPRPWDLFEFHILGVPEKLLQPDEDYVLWFRFDDTRPADVLVAAVFLNPGTELSEAALPALVGLPEIAVK